MLYLQHKQRIMIKNFFAICFIFFSIQVFSQDIDTMKSVARFSSDKELTSYINKAKSNGLSLIEVEGLVNAQGASLSELQKLRTLWNAKNDQLGDGFDKTESSIKSSFGNTEFGEEEEEEEEDSRFGSYFFNNKNISEAPELFIATPINYRLGPGDELMINLYGASENSYSVQISRNGTVKFDRIAPVYLSGLSIVSAKNRLKNRLSKLYAGLVSNDKLSKVDIDVSLKKARSVVVNITGQVEAPGTYTISGFSSVLNALFAAGGPNKIGSYRNIKLLRNGKVNKKIDLYDYFVTGLYPNVYLRDQDVILVEAYGKQVDLTSGFKINGLFELKENEVIDDVLKFSGGFSSDSFKEKIFINRINNSSRSVVEFSKEKFSESELIDGDILTAKTVSDFIANSVSIEGSVYLPGEFDLSTTKNIKQLIASSQGFLPDALSKAILFRTNDGIENEIISIDLNNEEDLETLLIDQDRLLINSSTDLDFKSTIKVEGEVNNPATFDYKKGMTVRDALILASGFNANANKSDIVLIRNISFENKNNIKKEFNINFDENLNPDNNIELLPDDIISVRKTPYLQTSKSYKVEGEIAVPGFYAIKTQNFTVYDAIIENIEFLKSSSIEGISIFRDSIRIPVYGEKLISKGSESKFNFELVSGDIINVPFKNKTAYISGEVQQEGILNIVKPISAKQAIDNVGGFTEKSSKRTVYVEYQNGLRKVTKNFLFFKYYPRVLPGSKVVVPEKDENKNKTSVGEIVGYTTSLVSIIALINSL